MHVCMCMHVCVYVCMCTFSLVPFRQRRVRDGDGAADGGDLALEIAQPRLARVADGELGEGLLRETHL